MIDCNTPALHLSERIQIIVLGVENNISFMYNFLQKNSLTHFCNSYKNTLGLILYFV